MTVGVVLRQLTEREKESRHSGQAQRDPESSRALGALAEVNALDSRGGGNDGNEGLLDIPFTAETNPVIPGKRQRDPESSRALRILPRLTLWIPATPSGHTP